MEKASNSEQIFIDFFYNIKKSLSILERCNIFDPYTKLSEHDIILNKRFLEIKKQIHLAFSDSTDTPTIMQKYTSINFNNKYLYRCAKYNSYWSSFTEYCGLHKTLFGSNFFASSADDIGFTQSTGQQLSTVNVSDIHVSSIKQFVLFHDAVHAQATAFKNKEIITSCDHVTHEILPELAVQL
jgi:hypothetical protein